ncbi:MAG: armadillo-type protein, partial [Piptocephalis tieghemiana]
MYYGSTASSSVPPHPSPNGSALGPHPHHPHHHHHPHHSHANPGGVTGAAGGPSSIPHNNGDRLNGPGDRHDRNDRGAGGGGGSGGSGGGRRNRDGTGPKSGKRGGGGYGYDDHGHGGGGGGGGGGANSGRGSGEEGNRYAGVPLDDLVGELYALCKDQHGCRYLQKRLEEGKRKHVNLIYHEVVAHVPELMTDPFGNYLCQKLLEHCSDEQRTVIVEGVASELVRISLNMHGTRAVQKLIDYLSNGRQIALVVGALAPAVVTLIKDLNGNHVIQKCLNRLGPVDNQFIYDAVALHCIEVSTHRHGCCVLQRCIDHASDSQTVQLAAEITRHALPLVQDPFGNYVVQYILDMEDKTFVEPLVQKFLGSVFPLSLQKFSSNVIEKGIRSAKPETRHAMIEEMLVGSAGGAAPGERLDRMLRDAYANYVVQTALDFAEGGPRGQRAKLVEALKPLIHAVRHTPYGKRIQSKMHR